MQTAMGVVRDLKEGSAVIRAQEIDTQKSLAQIKHGIFRNYIDEPVFQVYFLFVGWCGVFLLFLIHKNTHHKSFFPLSSVFEMAKPKELDENKL